MINKIINLAIYYVLLLLGLIGTSWIIWSRFIRERTIRDIPDPLLTEIRFWILIYICFIYFYVIKTLIKEPEPNIYISLISKITNVYLWKPLFILDSTLKYNTLKKYYCNFMLHIIKYWDSFSDNKRNSIIVSLDIIPRVILVSFLIIDTFYFNKLEIFYKIILIGIIPFIWRYIQYSVKDIYDFYLKELTDKYDTVEIFEKGYRSDISRIGKTEAVWHYEKVSIEEYIEIMYDTQLDIVFNNITYSYVGQPYVKDHIYKKYEKIFNKPVSSWTNENFEQLRKKFEVFIPIILNLKITINNLQLLKKEKDIIQSKIIIFSGYLICWAYILIISYYNYPVELIMGEYLLENFRRYLTQGEDPFIGDIIKIE